jgi:DNA mismatch repair protein MutS2
MDPLTTQTLEFDRVRDILKRYASSPLGVTEIENLTVQDRPERVQHLLACVAEMQALVASAGKPPLGGGEEIRPLLDATRVEGATLDGKALLSILRVIKTGQAVRQAVDKDFTLLWQEVQGVAPLRELGTEIAAAVDDGGEIRDTASPELAGIRHQIVTHRERIRKRLDALLSSQRLERVVQEKLITLRNGRYVIPLKPDFSSKIEGIVHDRSASRATLYVEPSETVDMNNRLLQLVSDEAEEVRRLLARLSGEVRSEQAALHQNVAVLAAMDAHLAKTLFAERFRAVIPEVGRERTIHFKGARHPLLCDQRAATPGGDAVIPVDLRLGADWRTLIITGPNTGGKTVALKTLGLLVLMVQAGIPIPAEEGSTTGVFPRVFADIGDEQNIQEDLSTFSSHMRIIVRVLREADPESLVLLDELGTGTDPKEGAALGIAILEELNRRGALTAATTHYEEIKHHAYRSDGMMNASVAFDTERLCPAFVLEYEHLGTSHAFEISERIGLPAQVLARGREAISDRDRNMSQLIEELETGIRKNREVRGELTRERTVLEALQETEKHKRTAAEEKARKIVAEAREQLQRLKHGARRILKLAEQAHRRELDRELARLEADLETHTPVPEPTETASRRAIHPGAVVEIVGTNQRGVVLNKLGKNDRVQVLCDAVRMEVPRNRLKEITAPPPETRVDMAVEPQEEAPETIGASLNLIGLRVEEAKRKTESYIDRAHLGCLRNVQIIHGVGTGALRAAVAEILQVHPLVNGFRSGGPGEGGAGVTVVELQS